MAAYFLIDAQSNVVNCIEWDGQSPWDPPEGLTPVLGDGMWRDGWKWDGTKAYDPNPPPAMEASPQTTTLSSTPLGLTLNKV